MEKLDKSAGQSMDIVADNIAKLKELFPEILTENKIDFTTLQALLGEEIEADDERYSFNWHGKAQARRLAQSASAGTLRPCKEDSVDWEATQNLFIEGDNLEALKLLQKSYHKQVKIIYIDPPYNTGSDFVYPDNFHDNIKNYLELSGQIEGGKKIGTNSETSGRYHTDWLNMIYPRLKLARNLLADDGIIFISLDDNETSNLRKICDEIFGESNFIGTICHKSRASVSNDKIISSNHNFITLYAKNQNVIFNNRAKFGLEPELTGFDLSDERGNYKLVPVDGPGGEAKGNPYYTFEGVTGYFRFSEKTMREKWDAELVVKAGNGLQQKYYLHDARESRKTDTTWWDEKLYTSTATTRLTALMGQSVFDNPKPVELVQKMLRLWVRDDNDLVLDFFAGSGTTGHAVMAQNSIDHVRRRYILVQLPEPLDIENKDQKVAAQYCSDLKRPRAISELTKHRLKLASNLIGKESPGYKGDLGFKVFKLDSSNLKPWDADFDSLAQDLAEATEVVKAERSAEDVLFEILLKYGLDLTLPIATHFLEGKTVYEVGAGALVVCLDSGITEAVAEAIGKLKETLEPEVMRVVFKDSSFANDAAKVNAVQVLKQFGIDDVKSI